MTALDVVERTATFSWLAQGGVASGYVVEFGTTSGASNLATLTVTEPSVTWRDIEPRDTIYVRVKAQNAAGTGPATPDAWFEMPDYRNVIEALLLGTGPYAIPPSPRNVSRMMNGWPLGSTVVVRVPDEVVGAQFDAVTQTLAGISAAIGGLNVSIVRERLTVAAWRQQRPAGITITVGETACVQADGAPASCTAGRPSSAGYQSIAVHMVSATEQPYVFAHELGHAFGFEHLSTPIKIPNSTSTSALSPLRPVMGAIAGVVQTGEMYGAPGIATLFTDYELGALRRVYQAGLRPGSTAGEFAARGLIKP